jgi:hypothetical protein
MKNSIGFFFTALLAAGLLTGCNNSNNNNNGFGTNCGGPPAGFQVLYPRNGASRINPSTLIGVYVAANPALPVGNQFNFLASQSNGLSPGTSNFNTYTGPIPNPHNAPAPGSTVYLTLFPASLPVGPLTTVNLFWNDGGTGCTPNTIVSTFTTGP